MISTLPGDWHVVPAPVAAQVCCSGVGAAAAVGAARIVTAGSPCRQQRCDVGQFDSHGGTPSLDGPELDMPGTLPAKWHRGMVHFYGE